MWQQYLPYEFSQTDDSLHVPWDIYKLQINKSKIGLHWTDGQSLKDFQWTPNCLCIDFMFVLLTDVLKRAVAYISMRLTSSAVTNQ